MTYKTVAYCVVNADYIDPCIVSLSSFFRFNYLKTIVYYQTGTNLKRLHAALDDYPIEYRECEFPVLPEHDNLGDKYFEMFVSRESLPAYAMRLQALSELAQEYDIVVNFDLDTLFFNTVMPLVDRCRAEYIYGVSERRNRDRWVKSLDVLDIAPYHSYINTGFCVYGSKAVSTVPCIMDDYRDFLRANAKHVYCPEQDYLNVRYADVIREIPEHYNLMFTSPNYANLSPVMVHYLGSDKPWSRYRGADRYVALYYKRYLAECRRCSQYLSADFMDKISQRVHFL